MNLSPPPFLCLDRSFGEKELALIAEPNRTKKIM
jgi:hypothetical protein